MLGPKDINVPLGVTATQAAEPGRAAVANRVHFAIGRPPRHVAGRHFRRRLVLFTLLSAVSLGCGAQPKDLTATPAAKSPARSPQSATGHDHSGWWCPEHGVPEEVCTRCNSKLIASFKQNADWCDKHDRPDSLCFHCHPELEAKFAARYAAKFGMQPAIPEPAGS